MFFWSLNTRFYLTMENRWFLDEKPHFETTAVKAMYFWSLNTRFSYDGKPMVSCWETPIWNNGCKSNALLVLNARFYVTIENRWFLDEKLQLETTNVRAMYFWSLNTHFYLTMENRWFLDEKIQFETQDGKAMYFWSWTLVFTLRWKTDGFLMRNYNLKQRM